jgi:hypothetical protein
LVPLEAERELILEVELLPFVHSKLPPERLLAAIKTPGISSSAFWLLAKIAPDKLFGLAIVGVAFR